VFAPKTRVLWCAQTAHMDGRAITLPAEVVRATPTLVLIRARTLDGTLLFRWVDPSTLRESVHAKG
jgi:hypothetical protein